MKKSIMVLVLTFIACVSLSLIIDSIGYYIRYAGSGYTYTLYAQESEIVFGAICVGIVFTSAALVCMINAYTVGDKDEN